MGNQLVGKAQKIYPVEHYIQDLTDFKIKFQSSPGSTRFFKVAKCDTEAGPVVVKVFVIQKRDDDSGEKFGAVYIVTAAFKAT